ncbi:helix-turn-helix domain-containing protein [candidate division KSB1 bacterium]
MTGPGIYVNWKIQLRQHLFFCTSGLIQVQYLPDQFKDIESGFNSDSVKLQDIEIQVIIEALKRNNYKRSETAMELGIDNSTLWRKIKRFNINIP